ARPKRDDHLSLRRRRSVRTCRRDPAENGLQKCPFHGWRLERLENGRSADDDIVITVRQRGRLDRSVARARNTHLHQGVTWRHVYALCHCVFGWLLARCSTLRKSPVCSPPTSRTIH